MVKMVSFTLCVFKITMKTSLSFIQNICLDRVKDGTPLGACTLGFSEHSWLGWVSVCDFKHAPSWELWGDRHQACQREAPLQGSRYATGRSVHTPLTACDGLAVLRPGELQRHSAGALALRERFMCGRRSQYRQGMS